MKAFSRKASVIIVAMLALALLLAACGNNDEPTTTTPAGTDRATDNAPPAPPANVDATDVATYYGVENDPPVRAGGIHEPRDLGGQVLRVGGWWEGMLPFAPDEEPDPAETANYFIARMVWENAQRVFEEFNFTWEDVQLEYEYVLETLTASVMAGDAFADMTMLSGGMTLSAIRGDLIQSLDSLGLANSDILGPQIYAHVMIDAFGHPWSFVDNRPEVNAAFLGVNLDIINAIGAQNPVDLYNSGQWNWANMLEIMRLATRDTTGDGMFDQFGIAAQPGDIAFNLMGANDAPMVSDDLTYAFDHPNTIRTLEFIESIFVERLWQYDHAHAPDFGDWGTNFWAWQQGDAALFVGATWAMNDGDLPFEFAAVPFPLGPDNVSGNVRMSGWEQGFVIPQSIRWNGADVLMVFEELTSWPGDEPDLMMEDGLGWPRGIFLTEDDVQRVAYAGRHTNRDLGRVIPEYDWVLNQFIESFATNEMTVLQAVETHRGPQQELLDNFFR